MTSTTSECVMKCLTLYYITVVILNITRVDWKCRYIQIHMA